MKQFIGDCTSNPLADVNVLSDVIDNAVEITKRTFLKYCDVNEELLKDMRRFPNDYTFYKNGSLYFYQWSAIEYFYS